MFAAAHGFTNVVEALLLHRNQHTGEFDNNNNNNNNNSNIYNNNNNNISNSNNNTALMYAGKYGHKETVKTLLSHGNIIVDDKINEMLVSYGLIPQA